MDHFVLWITLRDHYCIIGVYRIIISLCIIRALYGVQLLEQQFISQDVFRSDLLGLCPALQMIFEVNVKVRAYLLSVYSR